MKWEVIMYKYTKLPSIRELSETCLASTIDIIITGEWLNSTVEAPGGKRTSPALRKIRTTTMLPLTLSFALL